MANSILDFLNQFLPKAKPLASPVPKPQITLAKPVPAPAPKPIPKPVPKVSNSPPLTSIFDKPKQIVQTVQKAVPPAINYLKKQGTDFLSEAGKLPGESTTRTEDLKNEDVGKGLGMLTANISNATPVGSGVEHLGTGAIGLIGGLTQIPKVEKAAPIARSVEELADPVNKIIGAIRGAKPIRAEQEAIYTAERAKRLAQVVGIRGAKEGEAGFAKELGALKGELPKVSYEGIRDKVSQQDINDLFNMVKDTTKITDWEKVNAQVGLSKIFGKTGGAVPTEGELGLLKEVFGNEFTKTLLDKRPGMQKVVDNLKDIINIPKTLTSSVDLSAPLRQGIFLVGRPKQWLPAFGSMIKQFGSEGAYNAVKENIKAMPTYQAMRDHGLAITDVSNLGPQEEAFASRLANKLPLVRGSARAYAGFLNKLRADTFNDIINQNPDLLKNPKGLSSLAEYVNTATGRGSLPKSLEGAAPFWNGIFFSPRLMASRVNLLNPKFYQSLDPVVRKQALSDLVKTTGTIMSVLGLAKLSGKADVGADPTSADFGKIKVGNTRYDITGGFQPYIRLLAQVITGKLTSSTTGKVMTLGEGYRPLTRDEIISRFFASKESPLVSFGHDLLRGTNAVGDKLDFKTLDPTKNEILKNFIPFIAGDLKDLINEHGGVLGTLMGLPSVVGVGTQTYGGVPTNLEEAQAKGSVDLYRYLKSQPKEESNKYMSDLTQKDPNAAKNLARYKAVEDAGLGEPEMRMVNAPVKDGTRANMIADQLNKIPTKEEKNAYIQKLYDLKIMSSETYDLLQKLKESGKLQAPSNQQSSLMDALIPAAHASQGETVNNPPSGSQFPGKPLPILDKPGNVVNTPPQPQHPPIVINIPGLGPITLPAPPPLPWETPPLPGPGGVGTIPAPTPPVIPGTTPPWVPPIKPGTEPAPQPPVIPGTVPPSIKPPIITWPKPGEPGVIIPGQTQGQGQTQTQTQTQEQTQVQGQVQPPAPFHPLITQPGQTTIPKQAPKPPLLSHSGATYGNPAEHKNYPWFLVDNFPQQVQFNHGIPFDMQGKVVPPDKLKVENGYNDPNNTSFYKAPQKLTLKNGRFVDETGKPYSTGGGGIPQFSSAIGYLPFYGWPGITSFGQLAPGSYRKAVEAVDKKARADIAKYYK